MLQKTARRPAGAVRSLSSPKAIVVALATASFLQWTGAAAVLPLLPLFLRGRGSSDALIGAVMSAYFVGAFVAQYLAGRIGDRVGHRTVLLTGLVGYAVASCGFLLDVDGEPLGAPPLDIEVRAGAVRMLAPA